MCAWKDSCINADLEGSVCEKRCVTGKLHTLLFVKISSLFVLLNLTL
jgi:hypothetical protein